MVAYTPDDVARILRANPNQPYDLRSAGGEVLARVHASPSGRLVIWNYRAPRPAVGFVALSEIELGPAPYWLKRVPLEAK
ncbi:MAG: hypothetical protein N2318_03260 [Meiothermus sp.]|uniref:hypothetical protein n=1 Tax=Meiothermus sp. TaxID=1955249 RepID=UPI00298F27AB|nr:hypothetical protein [Meiothermus sp.]MCX7782645.1 hypothetical protein [Meiothermus sp.]MDW8482680.1 hypothetical protein [Meiothermus sp.]